MLSTEKGIIVFQAVTLRKPDVCAFIIEFI